MRFYGRKFLRTSILALLAFAAGGCSFAPVRAPEVSLRSLDEVPDEYRSRLFQRLGEQFPKAPSSFAIGKYLSLVSARLYPFELSPHFYVQVVRSGSFTEEAFIWGLLEDGGYIDAGLLKRVENENEIAALLAFAFERSQTIGFQSRFIGQLFKLDVDWYQLHSFTLDEDRFAILQSIERLYRSGYDPRGILRVLEWLPNPSLDRQTELREIANRKILSFPPLVNPMIRSPEYYQYAKEWMAL